MQRPVIVVHGGAWCIPLEECEAHIAGCQHAAQLGWARLCQGDSALDAVEAAVQVLEDDPCYDAGRGSYFNQAGDIEMDAIIMDGLTLNFGAVAAVQHIQHPVSLARLVMTRSPHNFLVGQGAEAFARMCEVPFFPTEALLGRRENLDAVNPSVGLDTVGAVALDLEGNLAVATSTGGTFRKWPGRVGDSPLIGCGAYADNEAGAVSVTGEGEALMRIVISRLACEQMAAGMSAQAVAEAAIQRLYTRVGGHGGIILIDRAGNIGLAHNTPNMSYAYILPEQDTVAGVVITHKNAGVLS